MDKFELILKLVHVLHSKCHVKGYDNSKAMFVEGELVSTCVTAANQLHLPRLKVMSPLKFIETVIKHLNTML